MRFPSYVSVATPAAVVAAPSRGRSPHHQVIRGVPVADARSKRASGHGSPLSPPHSCVADAGYRRSDPRGVGCVVAPAATERGSYQPQNRCLAVGVSRCSAMCRLSGGAPVPEVGGDGCGLRHGKSDRPLVQLRMLSDVAGACGRSDAIFIHPPLHVRCAGVALRVSLTGHGFLPTSVASCLCT